MTTLDQRRLRRLALRTAVYYLIAAGIWIVSSDHVVRLISDDPDVIQRLSTGKGWFFVAVTAGLLFTYLQRNVSQIEAAAEARQRALEALDAEHQRLDNIIDGAHVGTWEWNVQTGAVSVNELWAAMVGYTVEELAPVSIKTWERLAHPDDLAQSSRLLERHFAGELESYEIECRMRHKNGSWIWVLDRGRLQSRDAAGRPLMVFGTHTDVTARKVAELAVRENEERQRLFFEHAPAALAIFDRDMRYLAVSRRWLADYGPVVEDLLGRSHYAAFPDLPKHMIEAHRRGQSGEVTRAEADYFVRSDGRGQWLRWEVRPWRDALGEIGGIAIFSEDITAAMQAKEALRESEERFRQIAENMNEVFWIIEGETWDARLTYVSPAYDVVWGRSREALMRGEHGWPDTIHPEDRERLMRAISTKATAGRYDEIYRIVQPNGAVRWIHDKAFPLRDAAGRVYRILGTAEDITERHNLEEQFRQAQKMEAIGTLAGGIAHDFNNLLGAMMGFAELTRTHVQDRPAARENVDDILVAGRRAIGLVRQILAFSRRTRSERITMQMRPIVEEAVRLLRATIPTTIEIQVSFGREIPTVVADPTQVHQVVMNLGTNAWHAMRDRAGRLEITLDRCVVDGAAVESDPQMRPGTFARLSVRDTGVGMSREIVDRIFEPFFTTKPPGEGTGLGLSVVHGIVREHDGFVTVDSRPGVGSVFRLHFPASVEVTEAPNPAESSAVPGGHRERILVVDDEPAHIRLGVQMLLKLGYEPEGAEGAQEAIARVRAEPRRFDLVVVDHLMPAMTGIDLVKALRQFRPDLRAIMVTGDTGHISREALVEHGFSGLLSKPLSLAELAAAVRGALEPQKETPP